MRAVSRALAEYLVPIRLLGPLETSLALVLSIVGINANYVNSTLYRYFNVVQVVLDIAQRITPDVASACAVEVPLGTSTEIAMPTPAGSVKTLQASHYIPAPGPQSHV